MDVWDALCDDLDSALDHVSSRAIDLIEAVYDLDKPDSDWLRDLIEAHASILDHGFGIVGFEFVREPGDGGGDATVHQMYAKGMAPDFPERFEAARQLVSPECFRAATPAGYAGSWTEMTKDFPEDSRRFLEQTPALMRLAGENRVDLALLDDRVGA